MAADPDDSFRVCAADRLRQRGQPDACSRHGAATTNISEHSVGRASLASHEAALHGKHLALVVWRRGRSGHRIRGHAPDSAFRIPYVCGFRSRAHQRVAFHACAAVRVCYIPVDRGSVRDRSRVGGHAGRSD